jgi:CRP-like cAMP-binding protein
MHSGESFGDIALRELKPRSATVECTTDCVLAVLTKEDFDITVGESIKKQILQQIIFFKQYSLF